VTRLLGLCCLALWLSGCDTDQHSDLSMTRQAKYRTYQPTEFFTDGTSARPLMAGVVPADPAEVVGQPYQDPSRPAATMPSPVTREILERGQQQFNVFCSVCHGRLGNGDGMIVQRGFTRPPSYHIDRLRNETDAHFFDVISNGYGAMYSYGDRVPPARRWEIVAYVRALQAASADPRLGEAERRALLGSGTEHASEGGIR
jgi:mono/diheme cytochrome c family protein